MIQEFEVGDATEIRNQRALAKEQLGMETPLRSAGAYSSPNNPWAKRFGGRDKRECVCRAEEEDTMEAARAR